MSVNVAVTGATGYLGEEIVGELLAREGVRVVAVGRSLERLELLRRRYHDSSDRLEVVCADLLDRYPLPEGTDVIIHAAAVRPVGGGPEPREMVRANVEATLRVIRGAVESGGCRRFVYVSTQSVYGRTGAPWDENSPLAPEGAYALTKYAGERIAETFDDALDVIVVRLSRLYGVTPNTRRDELPGRFARCVLEGKPLVIHGTGEQRLDLVHVSDASRAVVAAGLLSRVGASRVFNVGGGASVSINELAGIYQELAEQRSLPDVVLLREEDAAQNGRHLELVIDRATAELGWSPRIGLEEGLSAYLAPNPL
ncbi:MAG: NAD(P)-dependent oxidoreductase, partial [Candidatus Bipolaricaulia bacterium]